jgi:hypothetical protein
VQTRERADEITDDIGDDRQAEYFIRFVVVISIDKQSAYLRLKSLNDVSNHGSCTKDL